MENLADDDSKDCQKSTGGNRDENAEMPRIKRKKKTRKN
jgi:hypothetical protein